VRIVLFVEGDTEYAVLPAFLRRWFDTQHLGSVSVQAERFVGCGELVREAPKKARKYLDDPRRGKETVVISLLDYHGAPLKWPGSAESLDARLTWGRRKMETGVGNARFRQFFAVHELEAWLLSQPAILPRGVQPGIPSNAPETVDDNEPPGKLLDRLFLKALNRGYKKRVDGATLFGKLDPEIAAARCPHLREMLDEILALARRRTAEPE
jgi:hypothetical protein